MRSTDLLNKVMALTAVDPLAWLQHKDPKIWGLRPATGPLAAPAIPVGMPNGILTLQTTPTFDVAGASLLSFVQASFNKQAHTSSRTTENKHTQRKKRMVAIGQGRKLKSCGTYHIRHTVYDTQGLRACAKVMRLAS